MTSPDRYLVGNRVYRSGSYAPTQGTVDPTGYVERELRKRNTGMMDTMQPSQTRSGLAQAALQRLSSMSGGGSQMNPLAGMAQPGQTSSAGRFGSIPLEGGGMQAAPSAESHVPGAAMAALQHALQSRLAAAHAEHANGIAQLQQQTAATDGRPTVSSTGKIQPAAPFSPSGGAGMPSGMQYQSVAPPVGQRPSETATYSPPVSHPAAAPAPVSHPAPTANPYLPSPMPANSALPFDLQGSMEAMNASSQFGQLLNQLMMGRQVAQRDYATGMHQLDMQQPNDERGLLNQFAGRGLAHSSGYGVGYGNLENQYAGERSGLADTLAQLLTNYGLQQAQGQGDYNQQLAAIKLAIASRLSGQAGNLGLGH